MATDVPMNVCQVALRKILQLSGVFFFLNIGTKKFKIAETLKAIDGEEKYDFCLVNIFRPYTLSVVVTTDFQLNMSSTKFTSK